MHKYIHLNVKKRGQVGTVQPPPLCCTLGTVWTCGLLLSIIYYVYVEFESNNRYLLYSKHDSERR